ncbi:unnamed protein product [Closterium sp. Naga37s-1]|nr:unnamed protein product [Closterium sp. Naga37s-1]
MRQEWGYCLPFTRPVALTDLYPSPCILTECNSYVHLGASFETSQSSQIEATDRVLEFGNLGSRKGNQAREGLGEGEGEWRSGEDRPPGSRDGGIGRGGRVVARCADSTDDVAMAGGERKCRKHPHALAHVAACALRGQPAALYVLHALRARTAAPAAPTAPTSSQKRDPAAAAATARVAQAVARQGVEQAVLGEVVADGHVCRRLHCLAARLQAAPGVADTAAAAWAVPRVPADVDCQLASVPCPLAACRMVQQAADAGSAGGIAGGNACGDAAGGDVGSDGEEGSDWDSESGDVWVGWTGGESDDDESEGGEEGEERAESALLKSSIQHPLPPPQHQHYHATPRSQRGEPRLEQGSAVGAGGAGAEGDDAVLRGFGRALSLVLAQYEAGVSQLARTCIAALSASPQTPAAAADCPSHVRSLLAAGPGRDAVEAADVAAPGASDAVLLLAMRSRRLREQLRRLVVLLGMDPGARETAGGERKGHPWEEGALRGRETAGGEKEDAWSVVYQCPQMLMPSSSDPSSSGMRGMPLTPPAAHMHRTPHTHHIDRAVAASGGSRGLRSTMALGDLSSLHPSLAAAAAATAAAAAGSAAAAGTASPATSATTAITRTAATSAGRFTPTRTITPSRMVTPSHLVTPSRQVIPSHLVTPSPSVTPSQFDTPRFLSNQAAAAGDAWSATLFLRPRKINHLLPLFLHPVSHLVVRTAQQQHILLSAPSPTIRQLASRLSSLLSALLLPHSHPFPSLPTNGNKPRHIQPALASDWSIDFTLAGVARTREIVQHLLAKAELQVRQLLDALEPRPGAEGEARMADVGDVLAEQLVVAAGPVLPAGAGTAVTDMWRGTAAEGAAVTGMESSVTGVASGGQALGGKEEEREGGQGGKEQGREQICSGCGWSHEPSWHAPGDVVAAADWPWKGTHPAPLSNLLAGVQMPSNESARSPSSTSPNPTLRQAWVECGAMLRLTDPRSGPSFPWSWMACNEDACNGDGSGGGAVHDSGGRKQKGVEDQRGKHSARQRSRQSGKQEGPGRQQSGMPGEKQSGEPFGRQGGRGGAAGRGGGHVTDEERRLEGMAVTEMDGSFDDAMHAHLLLPIRASHALVSRAAVRVLFTVGRYRDHCTALHRLFLSPHSALPSTLLHDLHAVDWASLRSLPEQQHALSSALDTAISSNCCFHPISLAPLTLLQDWASLRSLPEQQHALSSALDTAVSRACLSSLPSSSLSRLHAFIAPSSLSSSALSSISTPPPHPMSPGQGGGGVGSASKQLTWSPLSAHRLGAFDFVRVGYDPGWPASVVLTLPLMQQHADMLIKPHCISLSALHTPTIRAGRV